MAIKYQSSFSSGELDPALHERTTLQKYSSALATARNWIVGKTGRLLTRPGSRHFIVALDETGSPTASADNVKIYPFPKLNLITIWYDGNKVKVVDANTGQVYSTLTGISSFTAANLRFVPTGDAINVFSGDLFITLLVPVAEVGISFALTDTVYDQLIAPTFTSNTVSGTGYDVSYAITGVINGVETLPLLTNTGLIPIAAGEENVIIVSFAAAGRSAPFSVAELTEARVYRKHRDGGAYGYIGSTKDIGAASPNRAATFVDFGQEADYSQTLPELGPRTDDLSAGVNPMDLDIVGGIIYQQRLLFFHGNIIEASRIGKIRDFQRKYPISADSALSIKIGDDQTKILWAIESDGLAVFTTTGVYLHTGALTPTNLGFDKKGNWVIDNKVPPLAVPGGVLFVDSSTNTVRQLLWSQEAGAYIGEELSIFSNHLFTERRVNSWGFQEGDFPLVWILFDGGEMACFTFEKEHQMRAWTRCDRAVESKFLMGFPTHVEITSAGLVTTSVVYPSSPFFHYYLDEVHYIDRAVNRYLTPSELQDDPEADKWQSAAAMDSMVSWRFLINDELVDDDLTVTPVVADDWEGSLTLSCTNDAIFGELSLGEVGTKFRHFHPVDRTEVTLTVTARASSNSITVTPSAEFPSDYATNPRLYLCRNVFNEDIDPVLSSPLSTNDLDDDVVTLDPVTPGDWDGPLTLEGDNDDLLSVANAGAIGAFLYYRKSNGDIISLEITARASDNEVTVTPSSEFPEDEAGDLLLKLYKTKTNTFFLGHLEDTDVSVLADGYVLASPNNNIEDYDTVTVNNEEVTLPDSYFGAIVHIGRPYTMDIETLDIDTVEQRPVLIESKTVNKVYVKTHQSRGLYIGTRFPDSDLVEGSDVTGTHMVAMDGLDAYDVNYEEENPILGNRYDQPTSRRLEITLSGDWKAQGKICIRQVDPVHAEILSIIHDMDDQGR
jgi:hypothetical protein